MNPVFYIAAFADSDPGGIYRCRWSAGRAPEILGFNPLRMVSYLGWSPDRRTLYAVVDADEGQAAAYRAGDEGELTLLNRLPTGGAFACHMAADPEGRRLWVANYGGGSVACFALAADGSLAGRLDGFAYAGRGPHPERQQSSHPHCTVLTPEGDRLAVVDLGCDVIHFHSLAGGSRHDVAVAPPGSGPRHLIFNAAGSRAYLVDELANTAQVFAWRGGEPRHLQTLTTLPENFDGINTTAAIRLAPDERHLFVSNRGADSIARFAVGADGLLTPAGWTAAGGGGPRDINFMPDGRRFLAACERTGAVTFFDYEPGTGALTDTGHRLTLPGAMAICR